MFGCAFMFDPLWWFVSYFVSCFWLLFVGTLNESSLFLSMNLFMQLKPIFHSSWKWISVYRALNKLWFWISEKLQDPNVIFIDRRCSLVCNFQVQTHTKNIQYDASTRSWFYKWRLPCYRCGLYIDGKKLQAQVHFL